MTDQDPHTDTPTPGAEEQDTETRDWIDDAADARTADDPRARAPHDAAGVPSTGQMDR